MLAQIINGKFKKNHPDHLQGPFTPWADVVWLPEEFGALLENRLDPDFVYPDDPRTWADQATLDLINQKTAEWVQKNDILDNTFPSLTQALADIDAITNLAEAKVAMKRMVRVISMLIKAVRRS